MRRTSLKNDACPIARSLDAVGDAWSVLVVRDAFAGKRRFKEFVESLGIAKNILRPRRRRSASRRTFVESLGIAKNILTDRLRRLVDQGVLEQVPVEGTAYHEYALTEKGRGLVLVLVALGQWGCDGSEFRLVDAKKGEPVRLELRTEGGRTVNLDDVRLAAGGPDAP